MERFSLWFERDWSSHRGQLLTSRTKALCPRDGIQSSPVAEFYPLPSLLREHGGKCTRTHSLGGKLAVSKRVWPPDVEDMHKTNKLAKPR